MPWGARSRHPLDRSPRAPARSVVPPPAFAAPVTERRVDHRMARAGRLPSSPSRSPGRSAGSSSPSSASRCSPRCSCRSPSCSGACTTGSASSCSRRGSSRGSGRSGGWSSRTPAPRRRPPRGSSCRSARASPSSSCRRLPPGGEHEELFAVPTNRRAVIVAGPAVSVRGDQLGLLRRTVRWTDPVELFVHPQDGPAEAVGGGARARPRGRGHEDHHEQRHLVPCAARVRARRRAAERALAHVGAHRAAHGAAVRGDPPVAAHPRAGHRTRALRVRRRVRARRVGARLHRRAGHPRRDPGRRRDRGTRAPHRHTRRPSSTTPRASTRCAGAFPTVRDFVREATKRLPPPSVVVAVAGSRLPVADLRSIETLFGPDTETIAFRVELGAASRITRIAGTTVVTVGDLDGAVAARAEGAPVTRLSRSVRERHPRAEPALAARHRRLRDLVRRPELPRRRRSPGSWSARSPPSPARSGDSGVVTTVLLAMAGYVLVGTPGHDAGCRAVRRAAVARGA